MAGKIFDQQDFVTLLAVDQIVDELARHHDAETTRAQILAVTTSEKAAIFADPYGIQTAWHGPGNISQVTHYCNVHVDIWVPNFGIQECVAGWPRRCARFSQPCRNSERASRE